MSLPPPILGERARVASVRRLGLLDTAPEPAFDRITRVAQRLLEAPMAQVTLVDERRQWCKSTIGLSLREVRRELSFCAHAIAGPGLFVVTDASADPRFSSNRLVRDEPGIRFYAGSPFAAPDGAIVGTVSVLDRVPRPFGDHERRVLAALARLAELEVAAPRLDLHDPETGLANRRGFVLRADTLAVACVRRGVPLTLVLVDVEPPFIVLPSLGLDTGEPTSLSTVAETCRASLRVSDLVGRMSRNRLALLLVDASSSDAVVARLTERIERRFRKDRASDPPRLHVASASSRPSRPRSVRELLGEAASRLQLVRSGVPGVERD